MSNRPTNRPANAPANAPADAPVNAPTMTRASRPTDTRMNAPATSPAPPASTSPAASPTTPLAAGRFDAAGTRPRARHDLAGLPAERLEAEVVALNARMAASTYEMLVMVGELDSRGSWATWGALSCAAWLAEQCDIEIGTARTQVRVARALTTYPVLDAAMATGDVSYAKARVLVPHLSAANADALIAIAETTPAGRLGIAIAAWIDRHDDPDHIAARQHQARACTWRTEPDGMVIVTARLTPEVAGAICAVIDTHVTHQHAPAGASLAQQRADALPAVITTDNSGPGVQAELVIHVTADGHHLTDGTPLTNHAVAGYLPDAFISLLMHDAERQPIDASPRRRSPTRRQRRVLDARQATCQHPGCTARAFLQYDHIVPHHRGGPTTLDNLQRLCGPHNRARHQASA